MATITKLEELEVWQLSRLFAKAIFLELERDVYKFEFGLKTQLKNASGSIMDNIAEGFGRGSKNEFVNHLTIAKGSSEEVKSQLFRCLDCAFLDEQRHRSLIEQNELLTRKIGAFIHYLNNVQTKGQKFKDRK